MDSAADLESLNGLQSPPASTKATFAQRILRRFKQISLPSMPRNIRQASISTKRQKRINSFIEDGKMARELAQGQHRTFEESATPLTPERNRRPSSASITQLVSMRERRERRKNEYKAPPASKVRRKSTAGEEYRHIKQELSNAEQRTRRERLVKERRLSF